MPRQSYVDGRYVPHAAARVSIEDRGLQFGDAVYEVIALYRDRPIDLERHLDRLERSAGAIRIDLPVRRTALCVVIDECRRRNRAHTGTVYIQVSRGASPRDHAFPAHPRPSMIVSAQEKQLAAERYGGGVSVITVPDERWGRCDIKSTGLLANVLAKQQARQAGAYEAWMVDAVGQVTEGSSSTAWIVDHAGRVVTRPLDPAVLPGVTRENVIADMAALGLPFVEQAFDTAEAGSASEAFLTSATSFVLPVLAIDGRRIGSGRPGPVTARLRERYFERAACADAGNPPITRL